MKSSTLLMIDTFFCWPDRVFMTWELNDTAADIEISLNTQEEDEEDEEATRTTRSRKMTWELNDTAADIKISWVSKKKLKSTKDKIENWMTRNGGQYWNTPVSLSIRQQQTIGTFRWAFWFFIEQKSS